MLITKYTSVLLQTSKKTAMVSPTFVRGTSVAPASFSPSGDAFLEPYMQGLSNDVNHGSSIDEVFDGSSNVFKKKLQDDYPSNEDRMSTLSSPVNSLDTPLDERNEAHFRLIELNAGSQGSLNQLISGDECSEASSENSSLVGDEETTCDITLVERLIRSHPIWFLPGIQRAGAFHLLQGKEDGNFVVRQSSHNSTMAISVRLPSGKGPYIEHYLIQGSEDNQIGLESSDNKFTSIPLLIAHYCQCCDELPVQLTLPRAIREAKNRQQLTSLALLGQEFWRYPMANPRQSLKLEDESPSSLPTVSIRENNPPLQNALFSSSSSSNSPASSLSSFESSGNNNNNSSCSALEQPSLGFDTDPNTPLEESPSLTMKTFKGSPSFSSIPYNQIGIPVAPESPSSLPVETSQPPPISIHRSRPTPPNTLNLTSTTLSTIAKNSDGRSEISSSSQVQLVTPTSKTPPPPPPRWTKPPLSGTSNNAPNFTVTTTLTFSVNKETSPSPDVQVACFQVSDPVEKVERHITSAQVIQSSTLTASMPTIPPTPLPRSHIPHITSPISPSQTSQVLSPVSEGSTRRGPRRRREHKESIHYHRSLVTDKTSDYEDIWGTESNSISTFKPQLSPRSLPSSSLDDFSSKNTAKKSSPSPAIPDIVEQSPVTPSVTSAVPGSSSVNENRFGMVLNPSNLDSLAISPPANASTPRTSVTPELKSPAQNDTASTDCKFGSPFYAEPADAIKQEALKRRTKPTMSTPQSAINRRSDPTSLHARPSAIAGCGVLERIDSKEELITNGTLSSSLDNISHVRNSRRKNSSISPPVKNAKPVEPPKVNRGKSKGSDATWTVDSSWEFIAKETSEDEDAKSDIYKNTYDDHKLVTEEQDRADSETSSSPNVMTFQEMIFQRIPELRLSPVFNKTNPDLEDKYDRENSDRVLSLENSGNSNITNDSNNNSNNSDKIYHNGLSVLSQISDTSDDTQTEFSEPWDSTQWEHLLIPNKPTVEESNGQINRCKSFKERLDPLLSPPRLLALAKTRAASSTPGAAVRAYAFKLAADKETVFANAIDNFISCTIESKETKPQVVMRNMRQFMSGMKNYLVTHGEREFIKEVESERSKLKSTEFLNLDAILEGVMHKLVITPLKDHLCQLFVKEYEENGAVQVLVENIRYARTKPSCDLGIREKLILPSYRDLEKIANLFKRLQMADSPLDKLEFLLSAIATIFHSVKEMNSKPESVFLGADDFLPIFVWVLVQTGMVAAEVEAEYMWGLLHPSLLSGEGGYYLTTLSSAVNVLKNFRQYSSSEFLQPVPWCYDPLAEFKCVLKVVVPNEMNGSLLTKTLPVRPNMTTKDVCKIIALKSRITNPQDYALFKLVDGEETILSEIESPQDVKSELAKAGKHCMFAYKRIDAKIAWPRNTTAAQQKLRC